MSRKGGQMTVGILQRGLGWCAVLNIIPIFYAAHSRLGGSGKVNIAFDKKYGVNG
jgi:hypothetical protein